MSGQRFPGPEYPPIGYWLFRGKKLKEIRRISGISEPGVNRACWRFEDMMERDKHLEEELLQIGEGLK